MKSRGSSVSIARRYGVGHGRESVTLRGVIRSEVRDHVAEVVIDNPPGERAARWPAGSSSPTRSAALGRDPEVRALIVAANPEIKGYQAGVDIKELAADPTNASLIGVNRGCWETFAAVYDCEVPVIAAVHGYCLGGGVGIAGNADIVVAADDATFGLPEVDRGALGVATHLARLVPLHKMRAMFFMGSMITVAAAARVGNGRAGRARGPSCMDAAREIAQVIAAKSPLVIRRAKESLNAIDPVDVKKSYRFEQGFTFELNLWGDSDELRQAFVDKRDADLRDGADLLETRRSCVSKPRVPVDRGLLHRRRRAGPAARRSVRARAARTSSRSSTRSVATRRAAPPTSTTSSCRPGARCGRSPTTGTRRRRRTRPVSRSSRTASPRSSSPTSR